MHSGGGRSIWWTGLLTPLLCGCVSNRGQIAQAMLAQHPPAAHLRQVADTYVVHCPDVLQVDIAGWPQSSGAKHIDADGCIDLGEAGRLRVDGETTPAIARRVAETVGVPAQQVRVAVADYNSQYLYLFDPAAGSQRALPYRGPETVLDLLHRFGGLAHSSALRPITVIRPHVAEGKTPEVFHVDLAAIVLRNDPETNLLLQPFDQVYLGPSHRSCFHGCLPPWLRKWLGSVPNQLPWLAATRRGARPSGRG